MSKTEKQIVTEEKLDTVSPMEFASATGQWQYVNGEHGGMLGNVILANHFDIPMEDLEAIVAEIKTNGAKKARAYVGIEKYDDVMNTYQMKLYFTGVDANGVSIFQSEGASAIYDFVTPCPPTCEEIGVIK